MADWSSVRDWAFWGLEKVLGDISVATLEERSESPLSDRCQRVYLGFKASTKSTLRLSEDGKLVGWGICRGTACI